MPCRLSLSWLASLSASLLIVSACTTQPPFEFADDNSNENATTNDNVNGSSQNDNTNTNETPTNENENTNGTTELDSDGDGFSDEVERTGIPGSDPFDPNDTPDNPIDSDGDGCSDYDETNFVGFCDANPNTPPADPIIVNDPDASFTFMLTVARHADATFTDAQIDQRLADAGAVLQSLDSECPDVATDTTFQRDGDVASFTAGGASLTAESQLDAVFAVAQDVKVVDSMVGVCGIPADDDLSIVLGCATAGGSLVITALADPDVWAHEWGHVQGLGHRDDCPRNVMHSFEVATNAVDADERAAFLTDTPMPGFARVAPPVVDRDVTDGLAKTATESVPQWLDRLAARRFLSGVPANALGAIPCDAADHLIGLLRRQPVSAHRPNVARMLGFTRNADGCVPLMNVITSASGELSSQDFATLVESFLALGRLSRYESDGSVLHWLIQGTDASIWSDRGAAWTYRSHRGPMVAGYLARLSTLALSLTQQPAALDHLRHLQDESVDRSPAMVAQINEAIARLDGTTAAARVAAPRLRQR